MKTKLILLLTFLNSFIFAQKLPEVIIDPNIFKNSLEIDRYEVLDSNDVCYQEGHYLLGNHRYITYTTLLANVGDI